MDNRTRNILNIIKSALTGMAMPVDVDIIDDDFWQLADKHKIRTMMHYGLQNCGVQVEDDVKAKLQNMIISDVILNENQLYYIKEISNVFNENNVDYVFLKGSVLKKLYPQPEMRRMNDIDILIKPEQYDKVSNALESLGFSFKYETNHEIVWTNNKILIELHKILIPSYNSDMHSYWGDGWDKVNLMQGGEYKFSDEDMFLYVFTHFAKHYRDSGIGITHMCDIYVLIKEKQFNFDYIYAELKKLRLYDFYINIKDTLYVWFDDAENTKITDYITKSIFNNGVYGLYENFKASSALKESRKIANIQSARIHRILKTIFLPLNSMTTKYSVLKKYPILLPIFWIHRWYIILFVRRNEIKERLDAINTVDDKQISEYEKSLHYVGLDYYF